MPAHVLESLPELAELVEIQRRLTVFAVFVYLGLLNETRKRFLNEELLHEVLRSRFRSLLKRDTSEKRKIEQYASDECQFIPLN